MTREEAIEILKYLIPIPHRGDGKSTRHLLQTNALAMAIKALEQEPILDKIRDEIEAKCCITVGRKNDGAITLHDVFEIIDKYKAEEREQIPDLRVTAEEAAEAIQNLTKAGISQEDIESSDLLFYDPDLKTGQWIYGEDNSGTGHDGWYCNQCGHFEFWDYSSDMKSAELNLPNLCPNCKAKMHKVKK